MATNSIAFALVEIKNVMSAVVLRDMRTRFFNHGIGFLVVPLWPLVHMLVLLTIFSSAGRSAPYGESANIFFATGLIPTLAFMYISRFMAVSLLMNKPLLGFPVVRMIDVMLARAFLETIAAFITAFLLFLILLALGDNPIPYDVTQAVLAYLSSIMLAVGVGALAGVITVFFYPFITVYSLFMIVVYMSSGVLFVASSLPEAYANALAWNPVVQNVEWMRSAYYPSYSDKILDKQYTVMFGSCSLLLGFLAERFLRRRAMEG